MTEAACSVITPEQMRDARTSLGWSRETLSHASGATVHFIHVYEEFGRVGRLNLRRKGFDGLAQIRAALEASGVEFIEQNGGGSGVRLARIHD